LTAQPVKVYADATIVFPMVVAGTFYKYWKQQQQQQQQQHDE
jgi:deoxyhypusine synthase